MKRTLDAGDRLELPFHARLDSAVGQVAHPPADAFPEGDVSREKAEADTLHATTNQVATSHAHRNH
jgi:hypothetical protein